jgi:glucokinase
VGFIVGVDIGGTKTGVVLGQSSAGELSVLERTAFLTAPESRPWTAVVSEIIDAAERLLEKRGIDAGHLGGVGVSCGGPLDSRAGVVQSPPNLPGWDDVPITAELERALGCPARLQNDANACALAEWRFGAGRGVRNMVFLTFGTGMGAGLIIEGRLYEGTNDLAGEVGHVRLSEEGPQGYGKTGTFEAFCSGSGIARLARAAAQEVLQAGKPVAFCSGRDDISSITAQRVGEAADTGDPLAREILAKSGKFLGRGCAMLIDILNPQRIVIGSIFSRCRPHLVKAMEEEIAREALPSAARACRIVPAALGERIGDFASLAVAIPPDEGERNGPS